MSGTDDSSRADASLAPPAKFRKSDAPPVLMDRAGILAACFVRQPELRGKTATELIGVHLRTDLDALLHRAVDMGSGWANPEPACPETQIKRMLQMNKEKIEYLPLNRELELIDFYLSQEMQKGDVEELPGRLWERALAKTDARLTSDTRLQSLLGWLRECAEEDYTRGGREALLEAALRDPWQQERLGLRRLPPAFPHLVATGPAPWRAAFLAARRFCASSLMSANGLVLATLPLWDQILEGLEFVPMAEIDARRPLYLYELEELVTGALDLARKTILRFLFACAELLWVRQRRWEHLVSKESGASADLVRLLNCLTSLVGRRLRLKTVAAVDAWSNLLLQFQDQDVAEGEAGPKALIKLKVDSGTEQTVEEVARARVFLVSTLVSICEVTRELPSVGTIMFNPNHKYKNPGKV